MLSMFPNGVPIVSCTSSLLSTAVLRILGWAKMAKKKQLASSAPWRGEEEVDEFAGAKLKVTKNPGETPVMHVPRKKSVKSKSSKEEDDSLEIDPELRYSFQRNYQV